MTNKSAVRSTPPKQVRDHMVTGEVFSLVWQDEYKAYKTLPAPLDLEPYYNHPDYISHNDEAKGLFVFIYRAMRRLNIGQKLKWLALSEPPGNRVLDYGAGTGDFVKQARNKNWEASGLEVNTQARLAAQRKGLKIYKDQSELSKNTYDAITLWHVLEHLEDPKAAQNWFCEHLSSKGVLIIAVPNYRSYDAKFYKEFWAAYDVPRHLWHFSKDSISEIFNDFVLLQTRPMWLDSFYVSLLSERYKKNKGAALRGILVGLLSNLKALFTKEPSSMVYVLKKRN